MQTTNSCAAGFLRNSKSVISLQQVTHIPDHKPESRHADKADKTTRPVNLFSFLFQLYPSQKGADYPAPSQLICPSETVSDSQIKTIHLHGIDFAAFIANIGDAANLLI